MKTLYLIRGASGSGKSTLAELIFNSSSLPGDVTKISADDYFTDELGRYNFNANNLAAAHKYCQDRCVYEMSHGLPTIIIHNTFTRQWELQPYRDLAAQYGYTVFEIICNNKFQNVHNVPADAVNKQRERFEY